MGFVERVVSDIVWVEKGSKVQGRLVSIDVVRFKDGGTNLKYRVQTGASAFAVFQGATQLNQKLSAADRGCMISVEYLGEDETRTMTSDKNRPKLFKVLVDAGSKPVQSDGAPEITDDDIPF